MHFLCISVTFCDPYFHGSHENGPEWPPSPLRLYQALVAGLATAGQGAPFPETISDSLRWLEVQNPPSIIAPRISLTEGYTFFVPNNDGDKKLERQDRLVGKHVRRGRLQGGETVRYLWQIERLNSEAERLCSAANRIFALGWGIDMAIGHGSMVSADAIKDLPGEHWFPVADGDGAAGLRVPIAGALADLVNRHQHFLARLGPDGLASPPPLTAYRTVAYRRASDPLPRPSVAFALLNPEITAMRPFDTSRHALTVAHMTRQAVKRAARYRWPDDEVARIVMGHGEAREGDSHIPPGNDRFAYLPLPTIEFRGAGTPPVVGSIRRVMLSAFSQNLREPLSWVRQAMPGQELMMSGPSEPSGPVAILSAPQRDTVVRRYVDPAVTWATVTPVVLPGYDDPDHYRRRLRGGIDAASQKEILSRLNSRIDGLLRKAITQAGFAAALAEHALIDWRASGFWVGADLAGRYVVPDYLKRFPRLHVRITWRDQAARPLKIPGPIGLGGGRFFGLGLFAGVSNFDA